MISPRPGYGLRSLVLLGAACVLIGAKPKRTDLPKPEGPGANLGVAREGVVAATNAFRAELALGALQRNSALDAAAQRFAAHMAQTHHFGHDADGQQHAERAKAAGYDYCLVLENLAYEYDSRDFDASRLAGELIADWKRSKGHRRNLVHPAVTEIGLGIARSAQTGAYFAVQLLGQPASARYTFEVSNATTQKRGYVVGAEHDESDRKRFEIGPRQRLQHSLCGPAFVRVDGQRKKIRVRAGRTIMLRD